MKKQTLIYWLTILPFGLFALAGIAELIFIEHTIDSVGSLGYPWYVAYIVGSAKIIGGIVIVFGNRFSTLKEWAYAGFTIEFTGALVSHLVIGGNREIVILILVIAITIYSHRYWQRNVKK
ncbi:DoxX family protein [Leptospira sp. GIMC2001]|uniref:DoxX family protein n=1 Tax=Leptospira sp. GIMC2001 TaxID=1513297 RepID=UPI00234A6543|nr:DoxX family protein [Leptospira sp. GIMC2001]WCL49197.1 DoxX family protein [Leptospira sp. GIMC2001]